MSLLWALVGASFLIGGILAWVCVRQIEKPRSWLGLSIGVALCLVSVSLGLSHVRIQRLRAEARNASPGKPAMSDKLLRPGQHSVGLGPERESDPSADAARANTASVDLHAPLLELDRLFADAAKVNRWLLLDGSRGIRPEYKAWVESHFGPVTLADSALQESVCWQRSLLFPYSSGVCHTREIGGWLQEPLQPLARTMGDAKSGSHGAKFVAAVSQWEQGVAVLHFQARPSLLSTEENCLGFLARGQVCAALELFPGVSQRMIHLRTNDSQVADVLSEFGLLQIPAPEKSLAAQITEEFQSSPACSGMIGPQGETGAAKISLKNDPSVTESLARSRTEAAGLDVVARLSESGTCAAFLDVEVPLSPASDPQAALRSLLSQLLEKPVWLTRPASVVLRHEKLAGIGLVANGAGEFQTWLVSGESKLAIADVSLSLISPWSVTDAMVTSLAVQGVDLHGGWSAFRTGPSAARVSIDSLQGQVRIDLRALAAGLKQSPIDFLFDVFGLAEVLLAAATCAAALSLVQSLAGSKGAPHTRQAFKPGTFFPVFVLSAALLWHSYRKADQAGGGGGGGGGGRGLATFSEEQSEGDPYVYLRNWPASWFPDGLGDKLDAEVAELGNSQKNESEYSWGIWKSRLENAQRKAKNLDPGRNDVVTLDAERLPFARLPGEGRLVFWASELARNWHYRKDVEYDAAVAAWRAALPASGLPFQEVGDANLRQALAKPDTRILLVPDIWHVPRTELAAVTAWVEAGGKLVASEKPAVQQSAAEADPAKVPDGPVSLRHAFAVAGLGKSVRVNYSWAQLETSDRVEISVAHRILSPERTPGLPWLGASALGKGGVYFLGLTPLEEASRRASVTLLKALWGEKQIVAKASGEGCVSAALVEPYGAPAGTLRRFAARARKRGVRLNWLVDPESFARMMPLWHEAFKRHGVVFVDNGTPARRQLAAAVWQNFTRDATSVPVLVSMNPIQSAPDLGKLPGPSSYLMRAHALPRLADSDRAFALWSRECRMGVANARVLPSADVAAKSDEWLEALVDFKAARLGEAYFLARRLEELTHAKAPLAVASQPQNAQSTTSPLDPLSRQQEAP